MAFWMTNHAIVKPEATEATEEPSGRLELNKEGSGEDSAG